MHWLPFGDIARPTDAETTRVDVDRHAAAEDAIGALVAAGPGPDELGFDDGILAEVGHVLPTHHSDIDIAGSDTGLGPDNDLALFRLDTAVEGSADRTAAAGSRRFDGQNSSTCGLTSTSSDHDERSCSTRCQ